MADTKTSALTAKATPASADIVHILDSAASNADKRTTVGAIRGEAGGAGTDTASVIFKPSVNSFDSASASQTISGGGEAGTVSTRVLETGSGGSRNEIGAHASYVASTADYATIGGGFDHRNDQLAGTINGGGHNLLNYQGDHGTIGGGSQNAVTGATDYGTIGGGTFNVIGASASADASTIAGGHTNTITRGPDCVVAGGRNNDITSTGAAGGNTVGGGNDNNISGSAAYGTIVGGQGNSITATGNGSVVGGTANAAAGSGNILLGAGNASAAGANTATVLGNSNTANSNYELVVGNNAASLSGMDGGITFTGDGNPSNFNADGDSQSFSFHQSCRTTDTSTVVYTANRSYASGPTVPTMPLNSALLCRIMVVGKRAGSLSCVAHTCVARIGRGASGTINIDSETWSEVEDDRTGGADPVIRSGVSTLSIGVVGDSAGAVVYRWSARWDCVLVTSA